MFITAILSAISFIIATSAFLLTHFQHFSLDFQPLPNWIANHPSSFPIPLLKKILVNLIIKCGVKSNFIYLHVLFSEFQFYFEDLLQVIKDLFDFLCVRSSIIK